MPFVPQPFGTEETLASLDETTPIAGLERREAERAIIDWEEERRRLGRELALMRLNTSDMVGEKWSHRFILAVCPTVEYSSFLFYGAKFAALMGLPDKPDHNIAMVQQLPGRYVPVFTKGCYAAL